MAKALPFFIAVSALIISCSRVEFKEDIPPPNANETSYLIPQEQALALLQSYLRLSSPDVKSGNPERTISNVFTVRKNHIVTRSTESPLNDIDCNELIYVVNFDNNQGFALLAADSRISAGIIGVIDEGNMSEEEADEVFGEREAIYKGFPLDGPGIISMEINDSTEFFLNPNTFDPYIPEVNDTLVGNFNWTANAEDSDNNEEFMKPGGPLKFISEYVEGELEKEKIEEDLDSGRSDDSKGQNYQEFYDAGRGYDKILTTHDIISRDTIVKPLIKDLYSWHQRSPFNDYYPKVRKYLLFGERTKAPAGCFPLAIGKIMAHFKYPSFPIFSHGCMDWQSIKEFNKTDSGKRSAAILMKGISDYCDCWYFFDGTFTFPHKIDSFLEHMSFKNVRRKRYNVDRVKTMLDNGCPVIIYAMPEKKKLINSHAWIIDGYEIHNVHSFTEYFREGELKKMVDHGIKDLIMLHCDFGWRGDYNGLFAEGVFNFRGEHTIFDDSDQTIDRERNYTTHRKIVLYDNPNKN